MTWLEWTLIGIIVAEKLVKLSPWPWDDIIVDGLKEAFNALMSFRGKS